VCVCLAEEAKVACHVAACCSGRKKKYVDETSKNLRGGQKGHESQNVGEKKISQTTEGERKQVERRGQVKKKKRCAKKRKKSKKDEKGARMGNAIHGS